MKEDLNCLFRFSWIINKMEGKILDIGSNNGMILKDLNLDITYIDLDVYPLPNFIQADAEFLPFKDESFDTIVLSEILEHVLNPIAILKEAKRVTKLKVIGTTPNEYLWNKNYFPFMTVDEMLKIRDLKKSKLIAEVTKGALRKIEDEKIKHLWHLRYYDKDVLTDQLKFVFNNFRIEDLIANGWAFFGFEAYK